jgi:hypothetical protein
MLNQQITQWQVPGIYTELSQKIAEFWEPPGPFSDSSLTKRVWVTTRVTIKVIRVGALTEWAASPTTRVAARTATRAAATATTAASLTAMAVCTASTRAE